MEEYDDNYYKLKWGFDKTINMGRALGIGFCYVKLSVKSEIYLYINLWKYNIAISRFVTNI